MALEKVVTHDGSFLESGVIQVRQITRIMDDGVEISKTFHRHVFDLDDDVTQEAQIVQDVASGLHTPARIAARAAFKQAQEDAKNEN